MKRIVSLLVVIAAILLGSVSQTQEIFSYTPATPPTMGHVEQASSRQKFKWLYIHYSLDGGQPGITTVTGVFFDETDPNNVTELTQTVTGPIQMVAATQKQHSCALFYEPATPKFVAWKFDQTAKTVAEYADISMIVAAAGGNENSTFNVADDCLAFRIDDKFFHWNAAAAPPAYQPDTIAGGWTNAQVDEQFNIAYANNKIFKYSSANKAYEFVRNETFLPHLSILSLNDRTIFYSDQQINATSYRIKLQFNVVVNGTMTPFNTTNITGLTSQIDGGASLSLEKAMITSTKNGQRFNLVMNIDWANRNVKKMDIPPALANFYNKVYVSDKFLYARNVAPNSNGMFNHSGYKFMEKSLVKLFESTLQAADMQDYQKTLIYDNPDKLILIHEKNESGVIKLYKDEKKSLADLMTENKDKTSPYMMEHTFPASSEVQRSDRSFKWLYKNADTPTAGKTTFTNVIYAKGESNNKIIISEELIGDWNFIANARQSQNCAIVFEPTGPTIEIHYFNRTGPFVTKIDDMAPYMTEQSVTDIHSVKLQISDSCTAFRMDDAIYRRNSSATVSPFYSLDTSAASFVGAFFDETFKIAINGQKLYMHNGTAYVQIATSDFNPINYLFLSQDSTKIIVQSSVVVTPDAVWRIVVKYFAKNGNTWNEIDLHCQVENHGSDQGMGMSPDFSFIGMGWNNGSGFSVQAKYINPSNLIVNNLTIPDVVMEQGQTPMGQISNNFVHIRQVATQGSNRTEFKQLFFKLDTTVFAFDELHRRNLSTSQMTNWQRSFIREEDKKLVVFFEEQINNKVTLIRRQIGNKDLQRRVDNIDKSSSTGFLVEGQKVFLCPTGCLQCLSKSVCQTCGEGFIMDTTTSLCKRCKGSCKTCDPSDATICLTCFPGSFKSTNDCVKCDATCRQCDTLSTNCTSCKIGQYQAANACADCPAQCQDCTDGSTCIKCRPGFAAASNGTCVQCTKSCGKCDATRIMDCQACMNGFEMVTVNTKVTCQACPDNCKVCASGKCTQCRFGYRVLDTGKCAQTCRVPCSKCSNTNPDSCTSCIGNYVLSGTTCKPDTTCNNDSTCDSCPFGFVLFGGKCYACQTAAECVQCSQTQLTVCAKCKRGFYLNDASVCTACPSSCEICSTENSCKKCKAGYTVSGEQAESACLACQSPCKTCVESIKNCKSCIDGYQISGWKCLSNRRVKMQFTVDADYNSITTAQLLAIENAIKAAVNKTGSPDAFTWDQLKSGSVTFTASVAATTAAEETTMSSELATLFVTGSSVGGLPIEASAFTAASLEDQEEEGTDQSTIIILAVVIPTVTISLVALLFILYKKGIIFGKSAGAKVMQASGHQLNNESYKLSEEAKTKSLTIIDY